MLLKDCSRNEKWIIDKLLVFNYFEVYVYDPVSVQLQELQHIQFDITQTVIV